MPIPSLYPGQETEQIKVRVPKSLVEALDAAAPADDRYRLHRSRTVTQAIQAFLGGA